VHLDGAQLRFAAIPPDSRAASVFLTARGQRYNLTADNRLFEAADWSRTKGIPAFIFHADFWIRSTDYFFLRSEMPQRLLAPITRFQIGD
jgi:hypothetical protein